jgi:hypothetical protein
VAYFLAKQVMLFVRVNVCGVEEGIVNMLPIFDEDFFGFLVRCRVRFF